MAKKRPAAAARKRVNPATHWRMYLLASVLLVAVLGATGIAAQLLWASPLPDSIAAATVSTAPPAANVAGGSTAAGASSSARTLYVYGDQLRPLVEETDGVQTLNIYGPGGQIIAQVVQDGQGGEEVRYLLADHLGSTRAVLDADGNAVARFEYAPYGETTAAGTAAAEVRYRYTGHPWDEAQGLYETPARGYDPTLGRFLSVDPQRVGASPYVYGGNNPVGFLDATGDGQVPFFVFSGMPVNKSNQLSSLGRSVLTKFGLAYGQQPLSASIFQSIKRQEMSSAEHSAVTILYGTKTRTPKDFFYSDKLYWIIGDNPKDTIKLNRLRHGLEAIRKASFVRDGARIGNEIVLIDTTKDGARAMEIRQALVDVGEHPRLVRATMESAKDRFGRDVAENLVSGGHQFPPDTFASAVKSSQQLDVQFPSVSTIPEPQGVTPLQSTGATAEPTDGRQSPEFPSIQPVTQQTGTVEPSASMDPDRATLLQALYMGGDEFDAMYNAHLTDTMGGMEP